MKVAELRPWQEVYLRPNYLFGVHLQQGWIFGRVIEQEIVPDDFTAYPAIAAGGAYTNYFRPDRVVASINRPVVYTDTDETIVQVFHGWNEPDMRIRIDLPINTRHGDHIDSAIGPSDTNSPWGWYLEGRDSPFYEPTGRGMFFALPLTEVRFALHNPAPYPIQPSSQFYFNWIRAKYFNVDDAADRNMIISILKEKVPNLKWGLGKNAYNYPALNERMHVKPVEWDGTNLTVGNEVIPLTGGA